MIAHFFDLENLTEKQKADHLSNVELTAMLQIALACIGNSNDHLAVYDEYESPLWNKTLRKYLDFYERMVGQVIPWKTLAITRNLISTSLLPPSQIKIKVLRTL